MSAMAHTPQTRFDPARRPSPLMMRSLAAVLFVTALAGCHIARQQTVGLPVRHSVENEQMLVLSDFRLGKEHALIKDLMLLRDEAAATLQLPMQRQQVVVYMFGDELRYQQYLRTTFPDLPPRRAYFVGTSKELAVYTYWGDRIQEDLRHEYTHGLLHASLQGVPLWLDEGLAEYFEVGGPTGSVHPEYAEQLAVALSNQWRPDLDRLERLETVGQMQRADYQEAWAWTHYMLHSGPETRQILLDYVRDLQQNPNPGSLRERLTAAVPNLQTRFLSYLVTLNGTGRIIGSL